MTNLATHSGGCACGAVRYRMECAPLFVNCCHCSWCQRETGSAFAVNAMIETSRVTLLQGAPLMVLTRSASGKGQKIVRCPHCQVALWSHYAGSGDFISFVRVGTLDEPARLPPDAHIFTSTRLPWVTIPADTLVAVEFYDPRTAWTAESMRRYKDARASAPAITAN
jgi:hypothetical protein